MQITPNGVNKCTLRLRDGDELSISSPPRPLPPKKNPTELKYQEWKQQDSIVLSWIISNIYSNLINQFLDYTTVRELWKSIETLLSNDQDEL